MPTPTQRSVKQIILLSLSTILISSSIIFSFLILASVCSQTITNVVHYYNALLKQQSPLP